MLENEKPVAVCRAKARRSVANGRLHNDFRLHDAVALAERSDVMMCVNIVVAEKLINGSTGTIVDIVYADPAGPRVRGAQPAYVVVDFGKGNVKWKSEHPWMRENVEMSGYFPVIPYNERCETDCCVKTQLPLLVGKAITIHKAQGMSIGRQHPRKKVVVSLGEATARLKNLASAGLAETAAEISSKF